MDCLDIDARLPPRKRLLAALKKKDSSDCSLSLPIPSISKELYARLHKILNSSSSPIEQIIDEINSVASDAIQAAAAARSIAMAKAEAAAKAKLAAKSALELVDLIRESDGRKFGGSAKSKLKKRRMEIKHLYENDRPLETDEDFARRLQQAMNGSRRILYKSDKKHNVSSKFGSGDDFEENKKLDRSARNYYWGSETIVGKKAKVKRKKLLLSQFNVGDQGKPEKLLASVDYAKHSNDPEVKIDVQLEDVHGVSMPSR